MSVEVQASPINQRITGGLLRCAAAGVAVGLTASALMVALVLLLT